MRINLRGKLFVGFGVALFIIGILALVGYSNIENLSSASAEVDRTHHNLWQLASVVNRLESVQERQQTYLITGDEQSLESFRAIVLRADREIDTLQDLTLDNEGQAETFELLLLLMNEHLARLQATVGVRQIDGFEAAQDMQAVHAGAAHMEQIRALVSEVESEVGRLDAREATAGVSARDAENVILVTSVIAFLLLSTVAFVLFRNISNGAVAVARAMKKIAQGDLSEQISITSSDEIGDMARSYREMQTYLQEAAMAATQIGSGDLHDLPNPRSELDALGNARAAMVANLKDHARAAELLADGDLAVEFTPLSDRDTLGVALGNMVSRFRWMVTSLKDTAAERQEVLALAESHATALQRSNEELAALARIARALASPGSFESNAEGMLSIVAEAVSADRAALRLPDAEERTLIPVAAAGPLVRSHPPVALARDQHGVGWRVFETGKVFVEQDHQAGGRTKRVIMGGGARSNVTLPITWGGSVSGILQVSSVHQNFFDDGAVKLLTGIADSLGVLVENARLRGSLERSIRDLKTETAERVQAVASLEVERTLRARVDNFVSIASHELRTPMTTLLGYSELLLTNEPPAEVRREWFQLINTESKRLTEILDEFLSVSRINAGTVQLSRERLTLLPLVRQVVQGFEMTSPNHQFEVEAGNQVPDAFADRDKIMQVLGNLLDNAVKYSPDGGKITIACRSDEEGSRVITSVRDQGVGIEARDHERVFEMFERARTDESITIRGTGVGLHVVKSLMELMGGAVWVESRRHHGSTFSFALPIAEEASDEGASAVAA